MTEGVRKSIWVLCGVLVLGVLFLATWGRFASPNDAARLPIQARPLGLHSERAGDELKLSWNPKVPPLNTSPEADLLIEDGTHRTQLVLSPDQIFRGTVTYSPYTDNVVFRMKAFDRNYKSTDEILQVIQSRDTPESQTAASQTRVDASEQAGLSDRPSMAPARIASPALSPTAAPANHRTGGLLHSVAKVGKAPTRLWPFHHRGPDKSH